MVAEQIKFSGFALSLNLLAIVILLACLHTQVRRIADQLTRVADILSLGDEDMSNLEPPSDASVSLTAQLKNGA